MTCIKFGKKGGNHGDKQKREHLILRKILAFYFEEVGTGWLGSVTVGYTVCFS